MGGEDWTIGEKGGKICLTTAVAKVIAILGTKTTLDDDFNLGIRIPYCIENWKAFNK